MNQKAIDELEQNMRDGAKKAYDENLFLTGSFSDFQSRIIESLIVINIAQILLKWAIRNEFQIRLEYPIRHFYNGAFPNFIFTKRRGNDNTKFLQRLNHTPNTTKHGRVDIVVTREPVLNVDGAYVDPKLLSLIGIEIKSINKSIKDIENDFIRMATGVGLQDDVSSSSIQAGYCLFYRRLDNPRDINSDEQIKKIKEEDFTKWSKIFSNLLTQKQNLIFNIDPIIISEGSFENLKEYYSPDEFEANEIAELTGLVVCYLVRITRK